MNLPEFDVFYVSALKQVSTDIYADSISLHRVLIALDKVTFRHHWLQSTSLILRISLNFVDMPKHTMSDPWGVVETKGSPGNNDIMWHRSLYPRHPWGRSTELYPAALF